MPEGGESLIIIKRSKTHLPVSLHELPPWYLQTLIKWNWKKFRLHFGEYK
jgi:hypothetical protein